MFKGIITGLVLSLSSVAFATPSAPAYDTTVSDRAMRDRPGYGIKRRPIMHWQTLSSAKRLSAGRTLIPVHSGAAYSKLKLEAAAGSTFVDKVLITFGNGQTQMVDLDKRLSARDPMVIDLAGNTRHITRVVVIGRGSWRSSFNLLAV